MTSYYIMWLYYTWVFNEIKYLFFNDTATTEIYTGEDTLSLHDALPIYDKVNYVLLYYVIILYVSI